MIVPIPDILYNCLRRLMVIIDSFKKSKSLFFLLQYQHRSIPLNMKQPKKAICSTQ